MKIITTESFSPVYVLNRIKVSVAAESVGASDKGEWQYSIIQQSCWLQQFYVNVYEFY